MDTSSVELPQPTLEQLSGSYDASKPEKKLHPHVIFLRAIEDTELTAMRNEAVLGDPKERRPPKPVDFVVLSPSLADQLRSTWERHAPDAFSEQELAVLGSDAFLGGYAEGGHAIRLRVPQDNMGFDRFRTDLRIFLDAAHEAVTLERVSEEKVIDDQEGARKLMGRMIRARRPSASVGYYERQSRLLASQFQRTGYLDDKNIYLYVTRGGVTGLEYRKRLGFVQEKLEENAKVITGLYDETNDYTSLPDRERINSAMMQEVKKRAALKLAYGGMALAEYMRALPTRGGKTRFK